MRPVSTTDRNGVPWSHYVRVVEFVDPDPVPLHLPPIHVARRVLFDGHIAPCTIRDSDAAVVDLSARGGTVLTLHVHQDDVQVGVTYPDGSYVPHMLGDRYVCTPAERGWDWQPVDPDNPDDPWWVVTLYVAEVHAR